MLLALFIGFGGRLLPTWMFINSMQLIAHTPLLQTNMPANLHMFLQRYLDLLRLNVESFSQLLDVIETEKGILNYEVSMDENSFFSTILNDCGYKLVFTKNLPIILFFALVLLICIVGFTIFDILLQCSKSKQKTSQKKFRHTAWMSNFTLRYFYEFFFEVFLCTLIHLVTVD